MFWFNSAYNDTKFIYFLIPKHMQDDKKCCSPVSNYVLRLALGGEPYEMYLITTLPNASSFKVSAHLPNGAPVRRPVVMSPPYIRTHRFTT